MDVSKHNGTPKWMVKIMENPIKIHDLGVKTPIFGSTPILENPIHGSFEKPCFSNITSTLLFSSRCKNFSPSFSHPHPLIIHSSSLPPQKKKIESTPFCLAPNQKITEDKKTSWWFFTNPSEKYVQVKLDHFSKDPG